MPTRAHELHVSYDEEKELIKECVTQAFKSLRRKGFWARQSFMCCGGCARAELGTRFSNAVAEKQAALQGAVFYTRQDAEVFNRGGVFHKLWLYYGAVHSDDGVTSALATVEVGQAVKAELEVFGLVVDWDGHPESAILVTGLGDAWVAAAKIGGLAALPVMGRK